MVLFRRGGATLEETEAQLDVIKKEEVEPRATLDALQIQQDLTEACEAHVQEAQMMLASLREKLARIEEVNDLEQKREIIEFLVAGVRVDTEGTGRRKRARITITYRMGRLHTV